MPSKVSYRDCCCLRNVNTRNEALAAMDLVLSDDEYISAAAAHPTEEEKPVLYIQHSTLA